MRESKKKKEKKKERKGKRDAGFNENAESKCSLYLKVIVQVS